MSDSLQLYGPQHASLLCPSLSSKICSNSNPLSWWCHPTISSSVLPCSPAFSLSSIRVFSNGLAHHIRWPNYWSFSISPSHKYLGLISFRIDWFDILAVQGTLKSLLQHHNLKASVLRHSAFFMVQLSHPYMTTGKTIALTIQIFVGKVMFLLFNTLSKFVINFLSRSKHLLLSRDKNRHKKIYILFSFCHFSFSYTCWFPKPYYT